MTFSLAGFAAGCHVADPQKFAAEYEKLRTLLEEVNREVNLTRITEFEEFNLKHAADSLSIARAFPEIASQPFKIADLGCGAGFPSLILALAFPSLHITAIDSTGKKIAFVRRAIEFLGLQNIDAVNGRAIELNRKVEFRNTFDIVTARAVAPVAKLYRESDRFLKRGGRWIFYKTPQQAEEEQSDLQKINCVNWNLSEEFELPGNCGRRLFVTGEKKI